MGPWSVLYFLCIVLFGRFYLINLVLAVVAASYENEVQNAKSVSSTQFNAVFSLFGDIPTVKKDSGSAEYQKPVGEVSIEK